MTRKEQIESASVQCCEQIGFIVGAEWSDENPKEGLVSIDKVCEWLEKHLYEYTNNGEFIGTISRYVYKKDTINQFRKAMEE